MVYDDLVTTFLDISFETKRKIGVVDLEYQQRPLSLNKVSKERYVMGRGYGKSIQFHSKKKFEFLLKI